MGKTRRMFTPYSDSNEIWSTSTSAKNPIPIDAEWILMPILLQSKNSCLKATLGEHWVHLVRHRHRLTPTSFQHHFYVFDSLPIMSTVSRIQHKIEQAIGFYGRHQVSTTIWHKIHCTPQEDVECGARICANIQILLLLTPLFQ